MPQPDVAQEINAETFAPGPEVIPSETEVLVETDAGKVRQDGKPCHVYVWCALCKTQAPIASATTQEEAATLAKGNALKSGFKEIGGRYFCRRHHQGAAEVYAALKEEVQEKAAFAEDADAPSTLAPPSLIVPPPPPLPLVTFDGRSMRRVPPQRVDPPQERTPQERTSQERK